MEPGTSLSEGGAVTSWLLQVGLIRLMDILRGKSMFSRMLSSPLTTLYFCQFVDFDLENRMDNMCNA